MKKKTKLMLGDNIELLKKLPDNCIDSVVTDPPYGLKFMNKKWDHQVPSIELWKEVYRVLKPGGHLLSFGGTRTYHRMVVNIEDAGFEIRDQIMWLYGSGFPKSHNIGKNVEKRKVGGIKNLKKTGTKKGINNENGTSGFAYQKDYVPGVSIGGKQLQGEIPTYEITNKWEGWGTALKPANEPIVLARKPLSEKTIADNVLKWGTGGINIDGCRVGEEIISTHNAPKGTFAGGEQDRGSDTNSYKEHQGRFPANIILDEEAGKMLDEQSDVASRFFYCAKVGKKERNLGITKNNLIVWENADLKQELMELKEQVKVISEDMMLNLKDKEWNTTLYGKNITEKYQKDMIYTISTISKMIIELRTLYALQNSNIRDYTLVVIRMMRENGLNLVENVENINQLIQNITKEEKMEYLLGVNLAVLKIIVKIEEKGKHTNIHSTVKPIKLMAYLCRLITPPKGIVLDPFMGSGSTGIAALLEGFKFCGMEMDEEYMKIAEARIKNYEEYEI